MSVRLGSILATILLLLASSVHGQPPTPLLDVKASYISGQPGFTKEMFNGHLVLDGDALVYREPHDSLLSVHTRYIPRFSIPLVQITSVTSDARAVFVNTETTETAEVVIFVVKLQTAAATASKITFAAKKAQATATHE